LKSKRKPKKEAKKPHKNGIIVITTKTTTVRRIFA